MRKIRRSGLSCGPDEPRGTCKVRCFPQFLWFPCFFLTEKKDEGPGLSITFLSFFRKQAQKPSLFGQDPAKLGTERDGESRAANFSKSVWEQSHMGSNPFLSGTKEKGHGCMVLFQSIGMWCNGNTAVFDSAVTGSTPVIPDFGGFTVVDPLFCSGSFRGFPQSEYIFKGIFPQPLENPLILY